MAQKPTETQRGLQHLALAGLIGLSLAAATPCATAQALCHTDAQHACCCAHPASGAECRMGCTDANSAGTLSAIVPAPFAMSALRTLALAAILPDVEPGAALHPITLSRLSRPAPPPKRYLLACTFRL